MNGTAPLLRLSLDRTLMQAIAGHRLHIEGRSRVLDADALGRILEALALDPNPEAPSSARHPAVEPPPEPRPELSIRLTDAVDVPAGATTVWSDQEIECRREGRTLFLQARELSARVEIADGRMEIAPGPAFASLDPFRQLNLITFGLLALLRDRGLFDLHGAALESPAGTGTLIIGPSGSGKSTTALNLLEAGYLYASDDVLLVDARPGHVLVVRPFRRAIGLPAPEGEPKHLVAADLVLGPASGTVTGPRLVDLVHPDLVLFPRISPGRSSKLSPLDPLRTCLALLPHLGGTLLDRDLATRQMTAASALAKRVTAYDLSLGSDALDDPSRVVGLLDQAVTDDPPGKTPSETAPDASR